MLATADKPSLLVVKTDTVGNPKIPQVILDIDIIDISKNLPMRKAFPELHVFSFGSYWNFLRIDWVLERKVVGDKMGGVACGEALVFGRVEVG